MDRISGLEGLGSRHRDWSLVVFSEGSAAPGGEDFAWEEGFLERNLLIELEGSEICAGSTWTGSTWTWEACSLGRDLFRGGIET